MSDRIRYICTLPEEKQTQILEMLEGEGLSNEDVQRAMDERICDLEDTILDLYSVLSIS